MDLTSLKFEMLTLHTQLREQGLEQKQALENAFHQTMANLSITDTDDDFWTILADLLKDYDENDPETKAMKDLMDDPEKFGECIDQEFGVDEDDAASRVARMFAKGAQAGAGAGDDPSQVHEGRCLHLEDDFPFYDCVHGQCEHECCRLSLGSSRETADPSSTKRKRTDLEALAHPESEAMAVTQRGEQAGSQTWDAEGNVTFQDPEVDAAGNLVGLHLTTMTAAELEAAHGMFLSEDEIEELRRVQ